MEEYMEQATELMQNLDATFEEENALDPEDDETVEDVEEEDAEDETVEEEEE